VINKEIKLWGETSFNTKKRLSREKELSKRSFPRSPRNKKSGGPRELDRSGGF
jgi:hypothetical protein